MWGGGGGRVAGEAVDISGGWALHRESIFGCVLTLEFSGVSPYFKGSGDKRMGNYKGTMSGTSHVLTATWGSGAMCEQLSVPPAGP